MRISIEEVREAIRKIYGWDDSPVLYIRFPGQSNYTVREEPTAYDTVDGWQIVLDINEEGEVFGIEFL